MEVSGKLHTSATVERDRRLCEPHSYCGCCREERNLCLCQELNHEATDEEYISSLYILF
jgi:hypothetical protein